MKILYIAPRFHTNQVPIIRGLLRKGHEVKFISHYAGAVENYEDIKPQVLGYSSFFEFIYGAVKKLHILNDAKLNVFRMKGGFPPKKLLKKAILELNPDVVITRERSCYSISATKICRKNNIPIILYDQSPLWTDRIKDDLPHRLVRSLTPKRRMTPVLGNEFGKDGLPRITEPGAKYIPFVMEPEYSPTERDKEWKKRTQNGEKSIRILDIGKYENRKNHLMMMDVFESLSSEYDVELTIIGECTTESHKDYFNNLKKRVDDIINEKPYLTEKIHLLSNLKHDEMAKCYKNADIFVLPSTGEPASISQLEAMAYSLPVICSDQNGTSCYVENGENGYRFVDGDGDNLEKCIREILDSDELRHHMGEKSASFIESRHTIENYINGIKELME